jgi:chromate transporter
MLRMESAAAADSALRERPSPGRVARLALWLGLIGFGGGYAVIAQLRTVVVERFRWLTEDEYADAVAVAQNLPGASGANFFTLLGWQSSGVLGAALATMLFLTPSAAMMVSFGAFYDRLRDVKQVEAIFAGMNPAVVAIVASVAWRLFRRSRNRWQQWLALITILAVECGIGILEVVTLTIGGALSVHAFRERKLQPPVATFFAGAVLPKLVLVFLRIGAGTLGGGMAMIPVLAHEVVDQRGWLTSREFSDAVTLGQITPGPIAITATFVGYRIAGLTGALTATLATFLPAFVATVVVGKSIQAFRGSAAMALLFEVLAPVTAGLVVAATISLTRASVHGWQDVAIAGASLFAVSSGKVPPILILIAAAAVRTVTMIL